MARAGEVLQYRDSSDLKVAKERIQVRTGRKWRAEEAVQVAEARLVGVVTRGWAGLGSFPVPHLSSTGKVRRCLA